eukprot:10337256-Ditylum_brightwellii.AAC.1
MIADRIQFHDPTAEDPDWQMKWCYALLVAAACKMECDVDNLWKKVPSNGRHSYPDYGQFVPMASFKAYCSAAPYAWADKKYWFLDK